MKLLMLLMLMSPAALSKTSQYIAPAVSPVVQLALSVSYQVRVPGVGVGSAVAVAYDDPRGLSILLTNAHVCSMTKGEDEEDKLGTHKLYVINSRSEQFRAYIMYTATEKFGADICLLYTTFKLPSVSGIPSSPRVEIGQKIINVSGPGGNWPMIHSGYLGGFDFASGAEKDDVTRFTSLRVAPGSSGSGVFNMDGNLIGLVYALAHTDVGPDEEFISTATMMVRIDSIHRFLNLYGKQSSRHFKKSDARKKKDSKRK